MAAKTATTAALAVAGLVSAACAPALAEPRATEAEHCVSLSRIERTEVVDDRNILFYMLGGDIYRNELPHRCPGLEWEESFMYRTSLNQLCDVDIITVLDSMGFGFRSGMSCGLGMFHPISEAEARLLTEGNESRLPEEDLVEEDLAEQDLAEQDLAEEDDEGS